MATAKQFYFYVLLCEDGSFYGGFTTDVAKRFHTHQLGQGAKYTKVHRPLKVLYTATFDTKRAALQAEYQFKHQSRSRKEQYLRARGILPAQWNLPDN
ncbi:GIY-YIG nuclease family protein [Fructilactobacillus hinvesii]|uniref:GIY-YIG nuclease family protein n=1 Tax=Fructilactobacillus hinvesii TaxID=2940300 RepID=A0ABY5BSQ5_9LACO|nr:GIY-YIG nuclease family protein [Fructilactobacillus hinvesii]USS87346.1 GIY-YIG nuclease family protein [Fructilactobacillus hinvesii]